MATLDRILNTALTPLRGPRCPACQTRPGRAGFAQAAHEAIAHATEYAGVA